MIKVTFPLKVKTVYANLKAVDYYVPTENKLIDETNALIEHRIKCAEFAKKYNLTGGKVRDCYRKPECLDIELLSGEL